MAAIIGWSHTQFGKLDGETTETLIVRATREAIENAGIRFKEIDAIYVGTFGGFEKQTFPAAFALNAHPDLRFRPATRVENACATGSAAVHQAVNAIASHAARFVLVVGAEKMTAVPSAEIGDILLSAAYQPEEGNKPGGFAGIFGRIAESYFQRYGDQSEALAMIAAKNHANGMANPYAQVRKDLGFDFCNTVSDKNPRVAGPLRRTDCSLVSDGAAALVMCDTETAIRFPKAIHVRAAAHVQDFLPMSRRDVLAFEGCEVAWRKAHAMAGTELSDISFVETHDCFTIAELIEYEAMGIIPKGEGARAIKEGWTAKNGRLPVNPSGGLKAKGHPIGATGVSMHVMAALQLEGLAGDMQVNNATTAGLYNMGGTAVANYVTILERLR